MAGHLEHGDGEMARRLRAADDSLGVGYRGLDVGSIRWLRALDEELIDWLRALDEDKIQALEMVQLRPADCPVCHVEPGEHCVTASGKRSHNHKARPVR